MWIQTQNGSFDYDQPVFDPRDIAHALGNICRFAGNCSHFYSVAEHSVRVCRELPLELKAWGWEQNT